MTKPQITQIARIQNKKIHAFRVIREIRGYNSA